MHLYAQQFASGNQTSQVVREEQMIQHYYDTFAPFYDSYYEPIDVDIWAALIQEKIESVAPTPRKILDVGCGTGSILQRLLSYPALSCIGIDISRQMLLQARDKLTKASTEHRLIQSSVFALGLQSNSFDVAIGVFGLLNLYSAAAHPILLAEIWRVLRPRGIFISDFATLVRYQQLSRERAETHHEEATFKIRSTLLDESNALEKKLTVPDRTVSKRVHFLDPAQVAAEFSAAQFEVIQMTSLVNALDLPKANRLMIIARKP